MALKRPKAGSKKSPQKKNRSPSPRFFFFAAFPNFVFLGWSANRFRLADLGGVEPLRKLVRPKLALGTENKKSQKFGICSAKVSFWAAVSHFQCKSGTFQCHIRDPHPKIALIRSFEKLNRPVDHFPREGIFRSIPK